MLYFCIKSVLQSTFNVACLFRGATSDNASPKEGELGAEGEVSTPGKETMRCSIQ